MKKIVLLLTILCFTLLGQAQTSSKTRIAVFDPITHFQIVDGTDVIVREITSSTVVNSGQYQIIDRRTIEKIQEEQNFTRSGMVSDTHVIEMGELAGAQCVLFSVLAKSGTKTLLTTKLLDVKSGTVLKQKFLLLDLSVDLVTEVEKITKELIGNSFGQSYNYSSNSSYASQSSSGSYSTGETNMTINLPSGDSFVMVYVQGGQFPMGCTNDQQRQCDSDESPAHFVTLSDYYIGETEVTQGLWQAVMSTSISQQRNKVDKSNYPMYYVSHSEAEEFCGRLNNLLASQLPQGFKFRLPTEAQWEYAARGGKNDTPSLYAGSDSIDKVAWYYNPKSLNKSSIHPVKTKKPNELGIYDMSGNVWEWCADWYNNNYYDSSPSKNPENLRSWGYSRVHRGGSYNCKAYGCRVTARGADSPETSNLVSGFRLVLAHEDAAEQHLVTEQDKLKYKKINEELERKRQNELKIGGWVDLGLPSGTLWKDSNEGDGKTYYTYDEAVSKFGNNLPTKAQFEELKNKCTWKWTGRGYTVKGPNGNSIKIPVTGYRSGHDNKEYNSNKNGYYWSSSKSDDDLDTACQLDFNEGDVYVNCGKMRSTGLSVRLVM